MKILVNIPDKKAASFMEVLKSISYVKVKPLTPYKADVLEGIKEAVDEMRWVKAGELKARNAEDLLDEL